MDPFSLTVGILALIKATKEGYRLSKSALVAGRDLTALNDEIDAVETVITNVQRIRLVRETGTHSALSRPDQEVLDNLTTLLVSVQERLQEVHNWIEKKLNKTADSASDSGDASTKIRRRSVVKRLSKIQRLMKELKRLRGSIYEAALLLNTCTVQVLSNDLQSVKTLVTALPQNLGVMIENNRQLVQDDLSMIIDRAVATICQQLRTTALTGLGEHTQLVRRGSPLYEALRAAQNQEARTSPAISSGTFRAKTSQTDTPTSAGDVQWGNRQIDNPPTLRSFRQQNSQRKLRRRVRLNNLRQVAEQIDAASPRMQTKFELSSSWFPEAYSQETRVPKFLCARYQLLDHVTGGQLLEWHVWWSASPRLWRMIRITAAATEQSEDRGTMKFAKKDWTSLQYLWVPPTHLTLPCPASHLSAYITDRGLLADDVTNLTLRFNDQTQLLEFHEDKFKPYEPEDVSHKSTYRSAEYLMNAQSLGCRLIPEREVIIKEIVSGFTAKVLIGDQECVEKKLPLATVHLEPFLYELKALYMLRHCPNVIGFVGVEVDNGGRMLQGFIRSLETSNLSHVLRRASTQREHITWSVKEKWAGQLIHGLLSAHKRGLVVGTLDVNEIGIDEQLDAKLLHVGHGRCDLHSGCLAPELRFRLGLPEAQGRLSDAHMTARQDIFALGLVLWLIADPNIPYSFITDPRTQGRKPWWKKWFCQKAHCARVTSTQGDKPCSEDHTDPVDLPPCDSSVPIYFQYLIDKCRASIPQQRATAQDLMAIFKEHADIAYGCSLY